MNGLRQVGAILWRDLVVELRTKESLGAMLLLALMTLVLFDFGFDLRVENVRQVAPGVLWVSFAFAGTLGLNRSLSRDQEQGVLEGLLLAPAERRVIYLGKMLANLAAMSLMEAVLVPLFVALFDISLFRPLLLPVVVLGTIGFVGIGTLLAAMTVNTRAREALLPVLLFPLVVPILIAAVKATGAVLDGGGWSAIALWVRLMVIYDLVSLALAYLTFAAVVEQ